MRVLVAVDGSPPSLQARDLVARLPLPPASTIWLMSAYQVPIDYAPTAPAMTWIGAEDAIRDQLAEEIERLAGPLRQAGRDVETVLVRGRPATEIVDQAQALDVDVIVLGSRGRGPLASMLLGSVSAEVADHAPCPVLVTRSDRISRLLVATDGSDLARTIPELLGRWGVFREMKADVVSVALPPDRTFEVLAEVYTLGAYPAEDHQLALERHRRIAHETAERLTEAGIPATSSTLVGDVADEIISAAQRSGADLIVTGSRGLAGLDRLFLGSVARNVLLHAPCSVLVVRPTPRR